MKVVFKDPRNTIVVETRMRYEVTKGPGLVSRFRSFDKYSGRPRIENLPTRYYTTSTQSGLNSHKRYFGTYVHVSYDARRKRLHNKI